MSTIDFPCRTAASASLVLAALAISPARAARAAVECATGLPVGWLLTGVAVTGALVIVMGVAALVWRFHQGINRAMADLESCTRKMADGNLQALVSPETKACRMTGKIGENVNELTLNLQEVLLLIWNLSRQDLEVLARAENLARSGPEGEHQQALARDLDFLRRDLQEMQNIVRQFEFYNVIMQEEKLLAKPEPATPQD